MSGSPLHEKEDKLTPCTGPLCSASRQVWKRRLLVLDSLAQKVITYFIYTNVSSSPSDAVGVKPNLNFVLPGAYYYQTINLSCPRRILRALSKGDPVS